MNHADVPEQLLRRFPQLERNAPLAKYSTYRIGGPASFLLLATQVQEVIDALAIVRRHHVPFAILGGGSNVLIADVGFPGLVIVMRLSKLAFSGDQVSAEAGVKLSVLLVMAATHGLGGLDFLAGIPGTVGGAVYGNAGSRSMAIGDRITEVAVLDTGGTVKRLTPQDCAFSYRTSRFKTAKEVILSTTLRLPADDPGKLQDAIAAKVRWKNAHQPTHDQSAGCVFQNVSVPDPAAIPAELRAFITDGQLSAWRVVATAGLQGKQLGGAQVSPVHANFIVNAGNATAEDIIILISYVKQHIRDRFGIQLREEIQLLGFDRS